MVPLKFGVPRQSSALENNQIKRVKIQLKNKKKSFWRFLFFDFETKKKKCLEMKKKNNQNYTNKLSAKHLYHSTIS